MKTTVFQKNNFGRTAGRKSPSYVQRLALATGFAITFLIAFAARAVSPVEIYGFPNPELHPNGLVQGADGNFYGTLHQYGPSGYGLVFQMTTNGAVTTLAAFSGTNGADPKSRLTVGTDGNFYGATQSGGSNNCGTVFQVTSSGALTRLAQFNTNNGASPFGELVQGADGNFYGTTQFGGSANTGTVFQLAHDGTLANIIPLNSMTTTGNSVAGLVQGVDGNFYGVGLKMPFIIFPTGELLRLVVSSGSAPTAGLVQDVDGNFYGTTEYVPLDVPLGAQGTPDTVFQMSPWPMCTLTTLFSFNMTNGSCPDAELALDAGGDLYGTTSSGGSGGGGNIFVIIKSAPVFRSVGQTAGALTLTWSAVARGTYQLQYCTNLTQGGWNNFGSSFTATNSVMITTDSAGPDPQRFYRILLQ